MSIDTPTKPAVFTCAYVPALAIGLGDTMYVFQDGRLTVADPAHAAVLRRHPWFGNHIKEVTDDAMVVASKTMVTAAEIADLAIKDPSGDGWRCVKCREASPLLLTPHAVKIHYGRMHPTPPPKVGLHPLTRARLVKTKPS
jgi:hypothetical protein